MKNNKFIFVFLLLIISFVISGCGTKTVDMNQKAEDGNYHYNNADLGFGLTLPKEFEYYQTQRKNNAEYTDLEFFVPTSDTSYAQEVPGYAKPVTIRVVSKNAWEADDNRFDKAEVKEIARKDNTVYAIIFWKTMPKDWQKKWSDDMAKEIINNFKIM